MTIKKIEDMNFYEILNVNPKASQRDIEKAYLLGKAAYERNSLAYYSLLNENERENILSRIEHAFKTLGDPDRRKAYDVANRRDLHLYEERVLFRKSTSKMLIEDGDHQDGLWEKIKGLFSGKNG